MIDIKYDGTKEVFYVDTGAIDLEMTKQVLDDLVKQYERREHERNERDSYLSG